MSTSSASVTSPSNTQPTSMRTSRPQRRLPRMSMRAGSTIDAPSRISAVARRSIRMRSTAASCARSLMPRTSRSSAASRRDDGHILGARHRDDVRDVVLALRVVRRQRADPLLHERGRRRHHARVDLVDRALLGVGVALLDDRAHAHRARHARFGPVLRDPGRSPSEPRVCRRALPRRSLRAHRRARAECRRWPRARHHP